MNKISLYASDYWKVKGGVLLTPLVATEQLHQLIVGNVVEEGQMSLANRPKLTAHVFLS